MKTLGKIISYAALGSALLFGYANAQSVRTETDLRNSDTQKGIALQRTELTLNPIRIEYDALKNFSAKDNQQNVGGIFLDKIVDNETQKAGLALMNVGNFDGKDETFWDAWTRVKYNDMTFAFQMGSSLRKTSIPRIFAIGSFDNLKLGDNVSIAGEYGFFTKNPLQNEHKQRDYGWIGAYTPHAFISAGNEIHNKHVFAAVTGYENFGYFGWFKMLPDGTWSVKNRIAVDAVDRKFYSNEMSIVNTSTFVVPSFFGVHLSPSQTRGNYTLKVDVNGNKDNTTATIAPGVKTDLGQIALGAETKIQDNQTSTGIYASYYNTVSVAGVKGSVEINYSKLTQFTGYVKLSKEF